MRPLLIVLFLSLAGQAWAEPLVFSVRGQAVSFMPFSVVAQPGESIELSLLSGSLDNASMFAAEPVEAGLHAGGLRINAPQEAGLYPVMVNVANGDQLQINLFVTVPASEVVDETLNGYRMGPSPPGHPRHPELYRAPAGFIEVSEDLLDTRLSPHFTLRQFLCKQQSDYPKYIALQESLLVLLEGLLGEVRSRGYAAATFGVISGYRTPWYNRKIGNVANSRHVYGDAMDLYVDLDGDGRMDDLDRDGDRDMDDVVLLADIANDFMRRPGNESLVGGVGRYRQTSRHGGFVHVDTRGYAARW